MKIIFLMEMVPVYGDKELEVTLYGDYELSPYFNGKFQTNEPILKAKYKRYTDKLVKKLGYEEMNQEALLKYIEKEKRTINLDGKWAAYGRKYSSFPSGRISQMMKEMSNTEIGEILNTYIISPVEYMYKPFINPPIQSAKKFNNSLAGNYCGYDNKHRISSTKEELEARLNSSGYVTDYYGVSREDTYFYESERTDY